jgi:glycosyltransferase involved in cell wall biosynthesis
MSLLLSRKKIDYMFITNSLTGGGAERAINIAVNELQKNNMNVGLIPINSGKEDLIKVTVPIFEVNRKWLGGPFSIAVAYFKIYGTLLRTRPKVVILNCDLPEFLCAFIFGPWKMVVVEHAPKPWSSRVAIGKAIRKVLVFRNAKWVVVSDHLSIWGVKEAKTEHIPNAIVESRAGHLRPHQSNKDLQRLVFIGRLTKAQKQPQIVIEIAKLVNLPVLFVGDGLYAAELKEMAEQFRVEAHFVGHVSNPWEKLENGDLLLVPSAWEGDGLVVVEAMLRSVPILLSDIYDFRRFGLPERFYCSHSNSFSSQIMENKSNLLNLVTNSGAAEEIMSARKPEAVAAKWMVYLENLK